LGSPARLALRVLDRLRYPGPQQVLGSRRSTRDPMCKGTIMARTPEDLPGVEWVEGAVPY